MEGRARSPFFVRRTGGVPIEASLEEEEAFVESFRKTERSDIIREVLFGLPKSGLGNPIRVFCPKETEPVCWNWQLNGRCGESPSGLERRLWSLDSAQGGRSSGR